MFGSNIGFVKLAAHVVGYTETDLIVGSPTIMGCVRLAVFKVIISRANFSRKEPTYSVFLDWSRHDLKLVLKFPVAVVNSRSLYDYILYCRPRSDDRVELWCAKSCCVRLALRCYFRRVHSGGWDSIGIFSSPKRFGSALGHPAFVLVKFCSVWTLVSLYSYLLRH